MYQFQWLYLKVCHTKKHWHVLIVFLLVGGTSKNSGTYLKYSYGWRLVAGDLGGATRGMLRHPNPLGQTPYTKPLILCFGAIILLTASSLLQVLSEKCLWLSSCFSFKHVIVAVGGLTTMHFCGSQTLTNPSLILNAILPYYLRFPQTHSIK